MLFLVKYRTLTISRASEGGLWEEEGWVRSMQRPLDEMDSWWIRPLRSTEVPHEVCSRTHLPHIPAEYLLLSVPASVKELNVEQ